MRFALYNIRYATGTGIGYHLPVPFAGYFRPSKDNLGKIIHFLKREQPDIIGLVEVDEGSYRSKNLNQAEFIAQELGYTHVYESKYGESSLVRRMPVLRRQGNAFITNQTIHATQFHFFRHGMKRLVIELEFDTFAIFLVHLSLKYRHRQYQLTDLHRLFKKVHKPMIVAGDFNVFWGQRELDLFMAATGLVNANHKGFPTFPSHAPSRQLDFILHSPEIKVTGFRVPAIKLSDHRPLVCEFNPPAPATVPA
jgi:endonuclease/exonuclease/phosphatase family metal-dependent hydrolase